MKKEISKEVFQSLIRNLIKNVGSQAESIISNDLGLIKKGSKYHCPNPASHKNGDRKPALQWDNKNYMFKCFACSFKLNIYTHYKEKGMNFFEIMKMHGMDTNKIESSDSVDSKSFKSKNKEKVNFEKFLKPLTEECKNYLIERGLNNFENVMSTQNITFKNSEDLNPKANNNIAFVYRNKKGEIIGAKCRSPKNNSNDAFKYVSLEGSNFNLYCQYQKVDNMDKVIIVEGEIDSKILKQFFPTYYVVSVPCGANSMSKIFEEQEKFFNHFSEIILISDNDESGKNMDKIFIKKFGEKVKLLDKKMYLGHNDINELLMQEGKDALVNLFRTTQVNSRVKCVSDIEKEDIENIFYIPTGFENVDDTFNDIQTGTVSLIAGASGGGKTTFTDSIANNAIGKGFKVLYVDGEHREAQKVNNLYIRALATMPDIKDKVKTVKVNKKIKVKPNSEAIKCLNAFYKNKLYLYSGSYDLEKSRKKLFNLIHNAVKFDSFHMVIIDNLMSLNSNDGEDKYESEKLFIQECQHLAKLFNVAVVLNLHIKKIDKIDDATQYSIYGSSNIPNYADNIMFVHRIEDQELIYEGKKGAVKILKNREEGGLKTIFLDFDIPTKTLFETGKKINEIDGLKELFNNEEKVKKIEESKVLPFEQEQINWK